MKKKYTRKHFLQLFLHTTIGLVFSRYSFGDNSTAIDDQSRQNDNIASTDKKPSFPLIVKSDTRYESLRKGFNKRIDHYPQGIALCHSSEDVSSAIQYAKKKRLPIAIKSGGHSMEGFSSNNGGLVIDLRNMNSVLLKDDGNAIVGPGCTLSNLYDNILPQNRIIPTGTCASVGLGGLTLGGGYGLFSRQYGLTCDSLLEATLVDGNGNIHSSKNDPELLWALRGGGAGNFGVVTELVYQTAIAPTTMRSHHFKTKKLDALRAKNILKKWFELETKLSDSCFSAFVLNGSTVNILVTDYGIHTAEMQSTLEEFAKEHDSFQSSQDTPLAKKVRAYYGRKEPLYFRNSSAGFYNNFADIESFIADIISKVINTPRLIYQVNTLGRKIKDPKFAEISCYPHRQYNFISELQAYWDDPSQEEKLKVASQEILRNFKEHEISAQYINYCSLEFSDWERAYYGKSYERLQKVKIKYDPDNNIRHPQSIKLS